MDLIPLETKDQPWYQGSQGSLGVTNFTRSQIMLCARQFLESPEYEAQLLLRIKMGTLPPAVEIMLWHYAYGKPIEHVEMKVTQGEEDLSTLSLEELHERAAILARRTQELAEVEAAIPAEYKRVA